MKSPKSSMLSKRINRTSVHSQMPLELVPVIDLFWGKHREKRLYEVPPVNGIEQRSLEEHRSGLSRKQKFPTDNITCRGFLFQLETAH